MMEVEYQRWVNSVAHALAVSEAQAQSQAVFKAFFSQLAKIRCASFLLHPASLWASPRLKCILYHHATTDGEARPGGRVKPFGSSRNESLKGGLLMKWIEIPWQSKEAEFAWLHHLEGTTKAWHRTPRLVLEGNCCVQVPPERHKQGTLAPAMTAALEAQCHSLVGVTKIQFFHLSVFRLSCQVGTQGFNELLTNAPQRLWLEKQLLFPPGCLLYLQIMLFTVKQSSCCLHMVRLKSQSLRVKLEGKKNCSSCSCQWGAAYSQGGWEPARGTPALRPSLGKVPGKPCLPQKVSCLAFQHSTQENGPSMLPAPKAAIIWSLM